MSRFFLVVRDENENLLSTFLFSISILENGAMKKQLILEVDRDFSILNFRETFRDRELLPMSALSYNFRWCPFLDSRILRIFIIVVIFGQATPIFRLLLNFDSRQCLGQELLHWDLPFFHLAGLHPSLPVGHPQENISSKRMFPFLLASNLFLSKNSSTHQSNIVLIENSSRPRACIALVLHHPSTRLAPGCVSAWFALFNNILKYLKPLLV